MSETAARPATWRSVFAVREFRYLWAAQAMSMAGDELARVAIAVLVFQQTHSALLTGITYATTYLPWLVGGPLLGGLADRYPRRTVMIVCNLLSAGLVAVLISAVLVRVATLRRPAARDGEESKGLGAWWRQMVEGVRLVFGDPNLRRLVGLAWLATFAVVPEGLAAPYANTLHGSAIAVGLLLAGQPLGAGIGGLVLSRFVAPVRRLELMNPLAVLCCLPLVGFVFHPGLVPALALLVLSGIGASYNLPANAAFVQAVPAGQRGQAFGLVAAGLAAGQGLSIAAAGAIADHVAPTLVIAGAGLLGAGVATLIGGVDRRFATAATFPARS